MNDRERTLSWFKFIQDLRDVWPSPWILVPALFREGPEFRSELLMGWLLRSPVLCEQEKHLFVAIQWPRVPPREYLGMLKRVRNWNLSEAGTGTSITTIASEYESDFSVGRAEFRPVPSDSRKSSGAFQRIVPPLLSVEALNDMSFVADESPKSVRRGLRLESIRMLVCVSKLAEGKKVGKIKSLRSSDLHEPPQRYVSSRALLSPQVTIRKELETGYWERNQGLTSSMRSASG